MDNARVILPREATEDMMLAGMASDDLMANATQGDAVLASYRAMRAASPNAGAVSEEELRAVAAAIKKASSERRYGKYDYSSYPGEEPPFVIRDEKAGSIVFRSRNYAETEREYERLCDEHLARAALSAIGLTVEG